MIIDIQMIQEASQAGKIVCSNETHPACSISSNCDSYKEGTVCEYGVGCSASRSSSSTIYICKKGRWVYTDWTSYGWCNFCRKSK